MAPDLQRTTRHKTRPSGETAIQTTKARQIARRRRAPAVGCPCFGRCRQHVFSFLKKIALLHYSIYRRQRRTPITMNYSLLSTLQRVIQISVQVQAYIETPSAIYQPYHIIIKKESRDRRGATACRGVAGLSSCRGMTSATPKAGLCASWQQRAWSCAPDACWRDAATAR